MNIKEHFKTLSITFLLIFVTAGIANSQTSKLQTPRKEKLLNGLDVLIWNNSGPEKVSVKLRVHRGAAFDPQGKEGTMSMLGNILFPNNASREFFEQDLGGSLDITTNYDFIQINITAAPDKILDALQTLSNAIANPQIDKETADLIKQAQVEKIRQLENDPAYVADKAVSERLFGDFPYGRPELGTVESLNNIDFVDIRFAKTKFMTPDSATLTISGDVKSDLVYRAVRRYFGGWVKADSDIPATFRLPDPPEKTLRILEAKQQNTSELRFAFRGVARNSKDFFAAEIIKILLAKRIQTQERGKVSVFFDPHLLAGPVVISINDWNIGLIKRDGNKIALPANMDENVPRYFSEPISPAEFNSAKTEILKRFTEENLSNNWLDVYTFKLPSFAADFENARKVTLENVQAVAEKFKKEPVASVLLFQNPEPAATPETADQE